MGLLDRIFGRRSYVYYLDHPAETNPYVESLSARDLYRTQANLHAVISFLADSIAQLPVKVYERVDETNRLRDRTSSAALLLYRPNKDQTAYEFFNALSIEYLLYGEAIVMILPDDSESGYQLRLIPSDWIVKRKYDTAFAPSKLYVRSEYSNSTVELDANQFVIFKQYNPSSPASYQSPIASLKQTLSEQINAAKFRDSLWRNSGRLNAYITRPANVSPWTPQARDAWVEAFRRGWSAGGEKNGSVPVLEDGMDIKTFQFSSKEAQYAESIQLTREDVAAAYHINASIIWHTNTQTYASAKDNARALYVDCLGPLLQMLQQRINAFLLPKIGANPNTYIEFDLEEKLKGSFEERASIYQSAAGVPYLTVNEVRAELNRPPVPGGDERVIPMNVLIGGQMSPQDSTPASYSNMYNSTKPSLKASQKSSIEVDLEPKDKDIETFQTTLEKFFKRQERVISTKLKAVTEWWDKERWDAELKADLLPIIKKLSEAKGREIAKQLASLYYEENTEEYLEKLAETQAQYINQNTYAALLNSQVNDEPVKEVFAGRLLMAATIAEGLVDKVDKFAVDEAIDQAVFQGAIPQPRVTKTWHTGDNPRPSHAAMDGETVGIDDAFSNGQQWPHEYGDPDEVAGCNCWVSVQVEW